MSKEVKILEPKKPEPKKLTLEEFMKLFEQMCIKHPSEVGRNLTNNRIMR